MSSASRPTVHIIEFDPALCDLVEKKAPYLRFKRIPVPSDLGCPEIADLGDLEEIEVFFGLPWNLSKLLDQGVNLPNLKWFHTISAGVDAIINYFHQRKTKPPFLITRSSISSETVSEYVLAQMLAHRRHLYQYYDQQKSKIWERSPSKSRRPLALCNFSAVLLGVGNIGTRLAALCKAMGMTVYGVTSSPVQTGHDCPEVDFYSTTKDLDSVLKCGDYIISILPSTPLTTGLLNGDRLQVCKDKKPLLISVGRGDIISEESILKAIRSEWISGAALDVLPKEPLPADSLLWTEPGVIVTPHVAMDMDDFTRGKAVESFLANYARFASNQELVETVDIERGY